MAASGSVTAVSTKHTPGRNRRSTSEHLDVIDHRVERGLQRFGGPPNLRQGQPTLQCGEHRGGQPSRVGAQNATGVHVCQTDTDRLFPPRHPDGDFGPSGRVDLRNLRANGADRTAALALQSPLEGDEDVTPFSQAGNGVQLPESRLLVGQDEVGLVIDDGKDQGLLIGEVVIELRAADLGRGSDLVKARAGSRRVRKSLPTPRRRSARGWPLPWASAASEPGSCGPL